MGINDTGVEAMYQWWRPETALLDQPDFGPYLDNQYDPREMIDTMSGSSRRTTTRTASSAPT